ncbi:MAG: DUF5675 family protein [Luteibaculaceae bacterium]
MVFQTQKYSTLTSLVNITDYYPFGKELRFYKGEPNEKFLSTQHERDRASSYDHPQTRNSTSEFGVFLSVDPLADQFNAWIPYHYVANNPIRYIDPDGRAPKEYNVDKNTGQIKVVSDKGGNQTDFFNIGTTNEQGSFVAEQTLSTQRGAGSINSFRFTETDQSTISAFVIPQEGKDITGFFLEPAGPSTSEANINKRIPEGTFNIEPFSGDKYKNVFRLFNEDVPKERAILFHTGNLPKDTKGCLVCGETFGKDFVGGPFIEGQPGPSRRKFSEIKGFLNSKGPENVKLNIFNVIPTTEAPNETTK